MGFCTKKKKAKEMLTRAEIEERWAESDEPFKMGDQDFMSLVQRFEEFSCLSNDDHRMNLQQFKAMMGVLGNTFLTERMFQVMDKDDSDNVSVLTLD